MGAMEVVKLREGLWQWACPHPAWREGDDWDRQVWSTYVECDDATVVIDPLLPADADELDRFWRALDGDVDRRGVPTRVLLTCAWHARSAAAIVERYGATVLAADPARLADGLDVVAYADVPAPAGITVLAPDMPRQTREVALRVGDDVLVTGDLIHVRAGGLAVAPATWHDDTAATARWYRAHIAETVARLLTPLPALILTGHGHEIDPDRIARFAAAA